MLAMRTDLKSNVTENSGNLHEEKRNLPNEQKIHLKRDIGLISAINLILNLIIGK